MQPRPRSSARARRAPPATAPAGVPITRVVSRSRLAAVLAILALWLTACAAPGQQRTGAGGAVFVASGLDGTVHRLATGTGHPLGPPLPVPGSPQHLAPAPEGGVAVLSLTPDRGCHLTHLAPSGVTGRRWTAHPLLHVPPPVACASASLAGDGVRYVALIIPVPAGDGSAPASGAPSCRLIVLDVVRAQGAGGPGPRDLSVCPPQAAATALAAGAGADGPVLYVGLWQSALALPPRGGGTVLALDPATGAVLARVQLAGAPEGLVLSAPPGGAPPRLFAVEGTPGPDERNPGIHGEAPPRWRLLPLDPTSLAPAGPPTLIESGDRDAPAVAAAPDGMTLYALTRAAGRRTALVPLEPDTGAAGPATVLPGDSVGGLLVTDERVLVPDGLGHRIWVVERRTGRQLEPVPVGRGPVAITLSPPR